MLLCKEVPCFENLQKGYCVYYRNIPGYCYRTNEGSVFFYCCHKTGYFLCGVEWAKRIVSIYLQYIVRNLKTIGKMSTLPPLGKLSADAHANLSYNVMSAYLIIW